MNVETPEVYYRVLGLQAGASRDDIKRAYRKLAKACHPDRFAQDDRLQQQALEKIKDINHAYTKLRALTPAPETQATHTTSRPQSSASRPGSERQPTSSPRFRACFRACPWALPTCLVVLVAFVTLHLILNHLMPALLSARLDSATRSPTETPSDTRIPTRPPSRAAARKRLAPSLRPADKSLPSLFFTVGSTKNEVLAIQGVPTLTAEHVWEYGGSRVYFRHGRVTRWEMWSRDPLKAQLKPGLPVNPRRRVFTVGSSKDEVLTIQGSPTRFTDRVWEYGYSRIYFDGNRVARWESWPDAPLRAKLFPSVPANRPSETFTIGSTKDEVLTIQGSPTRFTDRVWEYGQSRVYFHDDRVVRWETWRDSPLKARREPPVP